MGIYVFTDKAAPLKSIFEKKAQFLPASDLSKHSPGTEELTYIDVSGLTDADIKKLLPKLRKICRKSTWGIIDPKGTVKDTAALFFEGACDYFGPAALKDSKVITPNRLKEPVRWRKLRLSYLDELNDEESSGSLLPKTGIKLHESSFPGWKKMQNGKNMSFYLLYCAIQGKVALDSRLDTKVIAQVHNRFLEYLNEKFDEECDGLLWINTGKDCLFLVPPKIKCVEAAVKACIGTIVSAPVVTFETLGITIPVNFVFALHYGSITYKPPGNTGTIVSDAVNYIFHLGSKKAENGRLTVSGELPDKTVPEALQDCFIPAGEFEGCKIWHTKKFTYPRPWV
jgi:hypothetical protein